jgi:hypothetical protein
MKNTIALLILGAAACGRAGDPPALVHPAPRSWDAERVEGTRSVPTPPPPRPGGGGYPDPGAVRPIYLVPESRWSGVGREHRETRTLAGRARSFRTGVEQSPPAIPLRAAVWSYPATPIAAAGDSVMFATPWMPVARLGGEIECEAPVVVGRPAARLVALYRFVGADLVVEGWLDTRAASSCFVRGGGRDRLDALMDDLDMYARSAARRGVPVPIPRP